MFVRYFMCLFHFQIIIQHILDYLPRSDILEYLFFNSLMEDLLTKIHGIYLLFTLAAINELQ